jgi:hypothetical protein
VAILLTVAPADERYQPDSEGWLVQERALFDELREEVDGVRRATIPTDGTM